MNRYFILTILLCLGSSFFLQVHGQSKNWKKLEKDADEYKAKGDLTRAAIYYESAFNANNSNISLAYKAGNCYLLSRDYANAVKNLSIVKGENDNEDFQYPGFKFALALKQSGEYDKAIAAFKGFRSSYSGKDKAALSTRVEVEIQGCTFAKQAQEEVNTNISIQHLSPAVNTDKDDFAPVPFRKKLYFSSADGGSPKVYVADRKGESDWTNRQEFEASQNADGVFCNGSLTPDGLRYYHTRCEEDKNGALKCGLYVTIYENDNWSASIKLPDYINPQGYSSTHPSVVVKDNKEILYFASDRQGGKGGYDLWYTTRMTDSKGMNFTLPKNLGHNINTDADEITPFYDLNNETLYFSSNGHISAGGLDVFKSKGERTEWEVTVNLGFPINSPADDLYYIGYPEHGGGYLASNRIFGNDKVATSNDDIYYFGESRIELIVKGLIYDDQDANKVPLKDVSVQLFEINDGNEERVDDMMLAVADEYKLSLKGNKKYLVEINAAGYNTASFEIATYDLERSETRTNDIGMQIPAIVNNNTDPDPDPDPRGTDPETEIVIVPKVYNSADYAYNLPTEAIDAETGERYQPGTEGYLKYEEANSVAVNSSTRSVYWDKDDLLAYVEDAVVENVLDNNDTQNKEHHKHYEDTDPVEENHYFVIQVAAVRKFKEYKYEDLRKGQMSDYVLSFEPIEINLTRVMVVPQEENADGTQGFKRKSDALNALYHILNHTRFTRAFVVEYKGEERIGEGFRGMHPEEES